MTSTTQGFGSDSGSTPDEVVTVEYPAIDSLRINTLELQDVSRRLPIGFFLDGERVQDFELAEYTTEHDLALSRRNNEALHTKLGRFLPTIVKSIGGYPMADFAKLMSTSPQRLFERAYLADITLMVLNIRLGTVGTDIAISDQCRRCNEDNTDTDETGYHDLGQADVGMAISLKQKPVFEVPLEDGFEELGSTVTRILLEPMRMFRLNDMRAVPDAKIEIEMLYRMVCGLPDVPDYDGMTSKIFTDETYSRLTLPDRDRLLAAARKLIKLGPTMGVDMECIACGYKWQSTLPWQLLGKFCSEPASASK